MDRDGKEEKKGRIEKTKRRRKEGDMKKILLGLVIVFIMAVPALALTYHSRRGLPVKVTCARALAEN